MPFWTLFTDASGSGIGGFNLITRQAWSYILPLDILNYTTINHLEFFVVIVQILLIKCEEDLTTEYILIWIDNMTAVS